MTVLYLKRVSKIMSGKKFNPSAGAGDTLPCLGLRQDGGNCLHWLPLCSKDRTTPQSENWGGGSDPKLLESMVNLFGMDVN